MAQQRTLRLVHDATVGPRPQLVPSSVLGVVIFVIAEAMLFAGLISAFTIVRAGAPVWPPPGQPRLPLGTTALNSAALLVSGGLLAFAQRRFRDSRARTQRLLVGAILLGAFFVLFQGAEWLALIREGLTLTSSTHGSFFYLIVGMHALHAVVALAALAWAWLLLAQRRLRAGTFLAVQIFWYFVVGIWPILYLRVYL
jgi:heme/copper-type cytochrome/quinol oxidase subunit 3